MNPRVSQWRQSRARIEIVVTAAERRRLEQVAQENGGTVAAVIREAVAEYCTDVLERRGISRPPKA